MCFYDLVVWKCGYWRWGKFRERCHKEYRTGETCGNETCVRAPKSTNDLQPMQSNHKEKQHDRKDSRKDGKASEMELLR
ncbi:uncharacterized protein BKA55DRAFT_119558 [Fusarium redolens]|uniref:Uncharacterized protein n=1 Tax=Fusarium redolens TaxID=48865 RepID=A0A9P9GIW7_FUSRE|nr:uncharacterized protein BKA55DRAFT_119558 [Fusarium redolens]KAH7240379.1 hypothetical protein BKA55DRAFT_119558 [Fusarium redolens]